MSSLNLPSVRVVLVCCIILSCVVLSHYSLMIGLNWFSGVQSAAVNVVCELARKNPKNYLSLAPMFFKLMTTSTNNWMLIKIIKLVSFVLVEIGLLTLTFLHSNALMALLCAMYF